MFMQLLKNVDSQYFKTVLMYSALNVFEIGDQITHMKKIWSDHARCVEHYRILLFPGNSKIWSISLVEED